MLKMPVIHTPPPTYSYASWQQGAAPLDQFRQVDHTASKALIWNREQASTTRAFSPLFGFMGHIACTLLFASFLTLSGCRWFDKLVGIKKTETTDTSSMRALSDSDLFIGKSRKVWLKPNRELSKRLRTKLEGEAYHAARELIYKDVKNKVKAAYPNDCHFGEFTFGYEVAWNHFSYDLETVRINKNGWRLMRVLCKTTWKIGWCKQKYSGDRSMNISGSRIPYSTPNPALR